MKSHTRYGGIFAALLGTFALTGSAAISRLPFQPESRLWVEGTSTVRDFTCTVSSLDGNVALNPAAGSVSLSNLESTVKTVEVTVPVEDLKCGNDVMDDHLFKALKASEHPRIRFQLSGHKLAAAAAGEQRTATLNGHLQIAGQEKPITLEATVVQEASGALRVRGAKPIVMSEYGIKAPKLMMGTMKVGDQVTVKFDVVLKQ